MKRLFPLLLSLLLLVSSAAPVFAKEPDDLIIGSTLTLGEYEQDNDASNGPEPIEWIVLDIQDNKALILSKSLLDTIMYNNKATYITWEKCSLRSWLNSEFLETCFDEHARNAVLLTEVDNGIEQGVGGLSIDGGNDTEDRVFLLSYQEVLKYFKTESLRIAFPTDYAASLYGTATWYTRSPGGDPARVIVIHADGNYWEGYVDYKDTFIRNHTWQGIRPAMWIDLELVLQSPAYAVKADEFNALQDLEERMEEFRSPSDKRLHSTVAFGSYEQDNDPSDGSEPIEWMVLDIDDDSCLLLSKDILDVRKIMHWSTKTSWEKCELRTWLEQDFAAAAFSEEELAQIREVEHEEGNSHTTDRVFLLSYEEAGQYFPDEACRIGTASQSSLAFISDYTDREVTELGWWTRSVPAVHTPSGWGSPAPVPIEGDSDQFEIVTIYGNRSNYRVDSLTGVRPAIRVNLDAVLPQLP